MDLVIECNVELCKANCEMCPENQKLDPGRRRRDLSYNETISDFGKKVSGRFKVLAEDDLTALEIRENLLASGKRAHCLVEKTSFKKTKANHFIFQNTEVSACRHKASYYLRC